ncbi:MAG: phosphoenolpyruvate--protein phosphotransferase, partial [Alphaproteobacteria bacterium]|nr:phosphoenolpyruvate--protein phosphotransferase [Alphaproteobacteria bacterium]
MQTSDAVSEALAIQRLISAELLKQSPMSEKLKKILKAFVDTTSAKSALLYATIDENYLELIADWQAQNYKSNIRYNEGGIGRCAASKRIVAEVIEEEKRTLFCVPIVRLNTTTGVLVLVKDGVDSPEEQEAEYIETLALSLPDLLSDKEFTQYRNQLVRQKGIVVREVLHGTGLNKGYGVGKAVLHHRHRDLINIFAENIELEKSKLAEGRERMVAYFDSKIEQAGNYIGNTTEIIEAYRMFATDQGWYTKITADIEKGYTAEAAVEHVYEDMWNKLSATSDPYLKERLYDLRDVSDKLRAFIAGDDDAIQVSADDDIVIIAQTMGPADLMDYNYENIRGLIIEDCTPTMHVVIVAKALNIPVIAKIHGILKEIKAGETIAVNGDEATVYTHPSEKLIAEYKKKSVRLHKLFAELEKLKKTPTVTLDNIKINLAMNYGLDLDFQYIKPTNCDGIGLYRTEITFMSSEKMPDVETQERQYKRLFDEMGSKKIIFRSLDVGSDKFLPYWGDLKEENPALGWRSIRITLDRRALLRQQIRAMLRAAAGKELNVMFPMVSSLQEFLEAKETLMLEYEHEKQRKKPTAKSVKVGIMIEVPSVLFQLDELLQEVDFVSVGTNDLYQFVFACDRSNPRLSNRYDVLSAPFLKLMKKIVEKAAQYKVYCSVCGEMASNPIEAMALIGLGYRNLSVSGARYAAIKKMICSMRVEDVEDYVRSLLKSPKTSIRPQLMAYAY